MRRKWNYLLVNSDRTFSKVLGVESSESNDSLVLVEVLRDVRSIGQAEEDDDGENNCEMEKQQFNDASSYERGGGRKSKDVQEGIPSMRKRILHWGIFELVMEETPNEINPPKAPASDPADMKSPTRLASSSFLYQSENEARG